MKQLIYQSPAIFSSFSNLIAVQSTRHGGSSSFPYSSLNLGLNTKDRRENILENRRFFFQSLGFQPEQVLHSHQVHGNRVLVGRRAGAFDGYDAIITNQMNIFCSVTTADCTPILIYDAGRKVVAAIHAGWRGTVQQIVSNTLQQMKAEFNTQGRDCFAYIGACIDENSYEVGEEVAVHFSSPYKRFDDYKQKYFINLKAANQDQLLTFGIPNVQIEVSPFCTYLDNEDFFSHRKEKGKTGRMLAVIGMRG